jgi:hypothetical protein
MNADFLSEPAHFYTVCGVNLACTLAAGVAIMRTVLREVRELRTFRGAQGGRKAASLRGSKGYLKASSGKASVMSAAGGGTMEVLNPSYS